MDKLRAREDILDYALTYAKQKTKNLKTRPFILMRK